MAVNMTIIRTKGHRYAVNGVEVPSVTQIVRAGLGREIPDAARAAFENKANIGTVVHDVIDQLLEAPTPTVVLEIQSPVPGQAQRVMSYVRGFIECMKSLPNPEVVGVGDLVGVPECYAGETDCRLLVRSMNVVVDWKTTAAWDEAYNVAQLGGYAIGLRTGGVPVDELWGVHLTGKPPWFRIRRYQPIAAEAEFVKCWKEFQRLKGA